MSRYCPQAYIVVYAVDDPASLGQAEMILSYLKMSGVIEHKSVILVANKSDLVRSRVIRTAGKYYSSLIDRTPSSAL